MVIPEGRDVECLLDAIRERLKGGGGLSAAEEKKARLAAVMRNVPQGQAVPDDMLDMAGQLPPYLCF